MNLKPYNNAMYILEGVKRALEHSYLQTQETHDAWGVWKTVTNDDVVSTVRVIRDSIMRKADQ